MKFSQISEEGVLEKIRRVRSWVRGDERAPHKPLLLLMALAKLQRGEGRWLDYGEEVDPKLKELLSDFGPHRRVLHPEHPFWRLQNDGLWEVPEAECVRRELTSAGDARPDVLRRCQARGGLPKDLYDRLKKRPALVNRIATMLLERNFPESLHHEILDSVGFPWIVERRARRDPKFREKILRIYEHRCAICGYDAKLGATDLGLDSAHIKWHAAGGPDSAENGVALCSFHHIAFDRGAISIDDNSCVLVSQHLYGQNQVDELVLRYLGQPIRKPQSGEPPPKPEYVEWHQREVFWEPARK